MAKRKTKKKPVKKKAIQNKKTKRKPVRPKKRFWLFTFILVAIFLVSFLSFVSLALIDLTKEDYLEADIIKIIDTTVVLGNNCTAIVAQTSPERARSIELGLEKKIEVRPNTHDLFVDILRNFNITLESATMDSFGDEIYYATLNLKRGNEKLRLDSKPSDAVAIALRTGSPLYIKRELLENQGQSICK